QRVAERLGLSGEHDPAKVERDLCALFPRRVWIDISHRLLLHGRYVCTARQPAHEACCLFEVCPSAQGQPEGTWTARAAAEAARLAAGAEDAGDGVDARDLDDLFRRFAAAADMTALAAFYDRVAPELLLVAAHFGASGADAEDLVQATFVAAIEHAARYDPARPVLPWLLGILVNQARRERRRRGRAPAADRVPASLPVDPADAAAAAEAAAELADRVRALPAGYREAMVRRFVHGLMPVQIAHTLGVPPGTIKTRLRRGTEMLRRALPTGLATAAATVLVPARGLTAIRTVVLDAAARRTAVHASAVLAHAPARVAAPVWIAGACAILAAVGAGLAFRWRSDARGEASAPAPVSSSRAPPEHDPSGAP